MHAIYINTHLKSDDRLGYKVRLGRDGKMAFKFVEKSTRRTIGSG